MARLNFRLIKIDPLYDLRVLGLEKLRNKINGDGFLTYKEARCVLGRAFHLKKLQCRSLLLEMSKNGLIYFKKNKIFLEAGK